jgi:hypothetical protein
MRARGTDRLSIAERASHQDRLIKVASEEHSRTVEGRVRESPEERNEASQRGALTFCRAQSESCPDGEIKLATERHSLSVERRAKGSSAKGNQTSE